MSLSVEQRRIIALLQQGHKLLIRRSPIHGRIVGASLWDPERNTEVGSIPLWRVEKLVALGCLRQSPQNPAIEWIVMSIGPKRTAVRSRAPQTSAQGSAIAM
ncbi:hypothetical protein [Cupriavidus pauculus]|uniref:hypothetical protein n=1 Tax=Cupriavidus pauculus TaxID=82633 RepID=UPI001EE2D6B1|nr:hypothetical protein [Cupriavidus pauculus]GJG96793.1 hypothetical protein CBA19C6_19910 [Cupriavidus pauculus]